MTRQQAAKDFAAAYSQYGLHEKFLLETGWMAGYEANTATPGLPHEVEKTLQQQVLPSQMPWPQSQMVQQPQSEAYPQGMVNPQSIDNPQVPVLIQQGGQPLQPPVPQPVSQPYPQNVITPVNDQVPQPDTKQDLEEPVRPIGEWDEERDKI